MESYYDKAYLQFSKNAGNSQQRSQLHQKYQRYEKINKPWDLEFSNLFVGKRLQKGPISPIVIYPLPNRLNFTTQVKRSSLLGDQQNGC